MSCFKKHICIILTALLFSLVPFSVFATVTAHDSTEETVETESYSEDVATDESGAPIEDSTEQSTTDDTVVESDDTVATDETEDEVVAESADDTIIETEDVTEDESYEVVGQISQFGSSLNDILTMVGFVLIAVGVVGMFIVIICLIKSKNKPSKSKAATGTIKQKPQQIEIATAPVAVQQQDRRPAPKREVQAPKNMDELNQKLDFSTPEMVIKKEAVKKQTKKTSKKYDTQEILNEFLK